MSKRNYLNVGCGNKFHEDWVNVDMVSNSPYVIATNLLSGIPFEDNQFDVVYHSQVLEHIPKQEAASFIKECFRVLKPRGIIRVVVPDLENITREYLRLLNANWKEYDELNDANYEWILLELYDQTIRNKKGGMMGEYLQQQNVINEEYVVERIGHIGSAIRNAVKMSGTKKLRLISSKIASKVRSASFLSEIIRGIKLRAKKVFLTEDEKKFIEVGKFKLGGEIHYWMYDKYSLKKLLSACGFEEIEVMDPTKSKIKDWNQYELDMKNGVLYDPVSLFLEARKSEKPDL
ncbi:MAG: methyltransferase domain-containing protein [Chitinophagaceae bacterium]